MPIFSFNLKKYLPQPSPRISEKRAIQLNFAAVIIGNAKVLMIRSNFRLFWCLCGRKKNRDNLGASQFGGNI
jgi:hypothetical protein